MRALTDGGRRSLITFCFANVKTDDLRSPWLPLPTALLDLTVDVVRQIYSYTHRVNIVTSCQLSQQRCSALHHSSALVSDWLEGNSLANQNSGTNWYFPKENNTDPCDWSDFSHLSDHQPSSFRLTPYPPLPNLSQMRIPDTARMRPPLPFHTLPRSFSVPPTTHCNWFGGESGWLDSRRRQSF